MKKNKKYNHRKKKGNSRALTIALSISGVLMTGLVLWVGLNEWNIDQSYDRGMKVLGLSSVSEEETRTPEKVDEPVKVPVTTDDETSEEPVTPSDATVETPGTAGGELPDTPKKPEEVKPDKPKPEKPKSDKPIEQPVKKPGKVESPPTKAPTVDAGGYIQGQKLPKEPTYIKGILLANKKYPLPSTFAPGENKEARAAFDKMAAEAKLSGFNLKAFSTYRAYDYQVTLYERYAAKDGKAAADTYSARPGYSEHQTGLAFDIGEVNYEQHWASSSFGDTEAGKWVAANAHRFGFILRYPKGKESITGYMHESWHFRYVDVKAAEEIHTRKITLEEYLGK